MVLVLNHSLHKLNWNFNYELIKNYEKKKKRSHFTVLINKNQIEILTILSIIVLIFFF